MTARFAWLSFLLTALAAHNAQAATDTEHQVWAAAFLHARPSASSGFLGWLDVQDRRRDDSTLAIFRPALGYLLTERLAAYAGYAWIPTFIDDAPDRHEHRIWQQLLWSALKTPEFAFFIRPRLEQRFVDGGDDLGHRARLFLRGSWAPWQDSPVLLVLWDEVFYHLNDTDWGARSGFDQNRVFVGAGVAALPGMRFELGYLNVYLDGAQNNQLGHNLAINVFYNY